MQFFGQQLLDLGHVIPHRQYIGNDKQRADQQHQQEHAQFEHKPHQPAPCKWLALDSWNGGWFFNIAGGGNGIFSLMSSSLCVGLGNFKCPLLSFSPNLGLGIGQFFGLFCFRSDALFGRDTLLRFSFDLFLTRLALDRFTRDRRGYLLPDRLPDICRLGCFRSIAGLLCGTGFLRRLLIFLQLSRTLRFINMERVKSKCIRLGCRGSFGSLCCLRTSYFTRLRCFPLLLGYELDCFSCFGNLFLSFYTSMRLGCSLQTRLGFLLRP